MTLFSDIPEIDIEEFRARYPQMYSDPAVDDIYCDPGWRGNLDRTLRHSPVVSEEALVGFRSSIQGAHDYFLDS